MELTSIVSQVSECYLIVEPRTRVSRGFAFVTMDTVEDADRCVKYLNQSVLEGRYITVEKVKLCNTVPRHDVMIERCSVLLYLFSCFDLEVLGHIQKTIQSALLQHSR